MRARRFAVEMAIYFRGSGEARWQMGWTENISRSGVLFRVQEGMEKNTEVEMAFNLPLRISGRSMARILCRGSVVRTIPPTGVATPAALAARITRYRFLRPDEQLSGVMEG